jgi:purine-binding chemotaxis protein CheW
MRPQAIRPVAGAPPSVFGIAVIRGLVVPVVDAARLLGDEDGAASRLVLMKADRRHVALAVEEVVGVQDLSDEAKGALPPLLGQMNAEVVSSIGTLDSELVVLLGSVRFVPDSVWAAVERHDLR